MKKYNTKPIDFTGCHMKRWVFGYWTEEYPYITRTELFRYAEPIPVKVKTKRIMPPERAIPGLIAEGWSFDDSGNLIGCGISVLTSMFKLLGKPLSDPKASMYAWPSCIIEEVEDEW